MGTLLIGKLGLTSDYHLFGLMKEGFKGKHYVSDKEVKTEVMKWLKEQNCYEAGIPVLIRRWNIANGKTVTMLRSRDVIHWRPA